MEQDITQSEVVLALCKVIDQLRERVRESEGLAKSGFDQLADAEKELLAAQKQIEYLQRELAAERAKPKPIPTPPIHPPYPPMEPPTAPPWQPQGPHEPYRAPGPFPWEIWCSSTRQGQDDEGQPKADLD